MSQEGKDMKYRYTKEDDALLIQFSRAKIEDAAHNRDVITHFDKDGNLVLLEILNASRFLKMTSKALPKEVRKELFT
ncbi:MAG: hypothetical protein UT08_C0018G0054 [Candidatus Woesebacteria bacterium GW2011_GWB1_38_8]|uniref:DUF2283 domain-containing protein n=2 Tax=Candidatus Woeseibacteriota TaxID=1752722 RepID=A0A0G0KXU5_9BACT|nr:MAG: hypothetical protein UT08_C0018G0054 [Candidatus Woesebacteria bacterium GW2011_GWB1_38_8]